MQKFVFILLLFALTACSSTPTPEENLRLYKVGKPYAIMGQRDEPEENPYYDEVGEASWYGPGFHGKKTANGERFNKRDMTAAHRTLPMPSVVKVTNLENGKSANLRVNDRGPFAKDRIIDVSKKAAEVLGFHNKGMAHVRVQFMPEETAALFGGSLPEKLKPRQYASYGAPITEPVLPKRVRPVVESDVVEQRYAKIATAQKIQVGTFRLKENAKRVAKDVSRFGVAQMEEINQEGERLYRVRVGGFKTAAEADHALNLIQQSGYQDALPTNY